MTSLKTFRFAIKHETAVSMRCFRRGALMLTVAALTFDSCPAQEPYVDEPGTQVQTRGPVHEAFAGVINFDSVPGIVVQSAPPELIEEIPPDERPVGDDVTWIPGYWAWDDERSDFLWVSGIWRALPPGREWIVGYWADTTEGYQWTSGYWADLTSQQTTYLPEPPRSVEEGPNIEAPSRNHGWTPGNWSWSQDRYAWSPGYWVEQRSDWDWIPAHYVWTRRGHVFVDGYWDYPVQRRGVLFAPVYFDRGTYSRPHYSYSPTVAINLAVLASHLFLRPQYEHYYFGDYYASSYGDRGYYSPQSYQSSRRGYDPLYVHQRWVNRDNRDWERGMERDYQDRRDDEGARPPHTWAAQRLMDRGQSDARHDRSLMATSFSQMAKQEGSASHFQKIDKDDREALARRGQEVQKSRDERRGVEAVDADGQREGGKSKASKVPSSRSPIAAKAGREEGKKGGPPGPLRKPAEGRENGSNTDSKVKHQQPPIRPLMDSKERGKKADASQKPKSKPQEPSTQQKPGRPLVDEKGKDKKADAPQAPKERPQKPTTEQKPNRPSMDPNGKGKPDKNPKAPESKPKPSIPQERPDRPASADKVRGKKAPVPEVSKGKSEKPATAPEPKRRVNEAPKKAPKAVPRPPQTKSTPVPHVPKAVLPPAKVKGKKEDEESKGKKKGK